MLGRNDSRHPRFLRPGRVAVLAALVAGLATACAREPSRSDWKGTLRPDRAPISAELATGTTHRYRLPLTAGSFARVVVEQLGIDVEVTLEAPTGEMLLKADRPTGYRGPELAMAVADIDGDYAIGVRASEEKDVTGRYTVRIETLRPATTADRLSAQTYRRYNAAKRLEVDERTIVWREAVATWRRLGDDALAADALYRLGRDQSKRGLWSEAAALWREAAEGCARAGDAWWESFTRSGLASAHLYLAETDEAVHQSDLALALARRLDDPYLAAKALHNRAEALDYQGEMQAALDGYQDALARWPEYDRTLRPHTLHALGVLFSWYLGDAVRGREFLTLARDAWWPESVFKPITLTQLGRLDQEAGRLDEARTDFEEALELLRDTDRCGSTVALARLAQVEDRLGDPAAADAGLAEAFAILAEKDCPSAEVRTYNLAAQFAEGRGDHAAALADYQRCRELFASFGDATGEAESLAGIARARSALGDPQAALAASRQSLDLLEGVRPTILREDLRRSFFASVQDHWDAHIGLLTELDRTADAWETAEQARARALRDLLTEAGTGLRREADPALSSRERALQHLLNSLATQAKDRPPTGEQLTDLRRRIDDTVAELETVRGEFRRASARYRTLDPAATPRLAEVQRGMLDGDTVVLEFRLGAEKSFLWAVTRDAVAGFPLPPRREIEPRVREAARRLGSPVPQPGGDPRCAVSRLLLEPALRFLDRRRLVLVPDGALEGLAFGALPDPTGAGDCDQQPPMVAAHEIVVLPSVQALLAQRRRLAGREPSPGWLAVVADPLYGADDPRLGAADTTGAGGLAPSRAGTAGQDELPRLAHSGEEAEAVLALFPADKTYYAPGAAASRQTVLGGVLGRYRIVHFAVHGRLDAAQPLLSSLELSRVDGSGQAVDGALPAHEVYDLELPAELVVLSACETALGAEDRGEGVISGLPRAFLYAGASRVLVSLWPVADRSTRDLMAGFYRALIDRGLPPARALQEAQFELWREGRRPYDWAGFVLLGDWRPLPPFTR